MARLVGGLDVDQEQVGARGERRAGRRRACPRSSCRTSRWRQGPRPRSMSVSTPRPRIEVDGGDERRPRSPSGRGSSASAAGSPGPRATPGWRPAPKPRTISRLASITAWSCAAAGPVGHTAGLSERSWGGVQLGIGPVGGRHHDVAVLHAGVELDLGAGAAPSSASRASITSAAPLGGGVAAGEVDHRPVVADGDEVAAVGDAVGRQPQAERGRLDRRPAGVVAGGVVAEDRHVADVAARRQARRDHGGPADLAARGRAGPGWASTPPRAACDRRAPRPVRRRTRRARTPRTSWRSVAQRPPAVPERRRRCAERQRRRRKLEASRSVASTSSARAGRTGRPGGRAARAGCRWPARRRRGTWPGGRWPGTTTGRLGPRGMPAGGADADGGVRVDQERRAHHAQCG